MAKERKYSYKIKFLNVTLLSICALLLQFEAHQVNGRECAVSNVVPGNEPLRNEWPFVAALYVFEHFKYFCGGTLISNKHVLTAAHCVQGKGSQLKRNPNEILVRLGAYNLTVNFEKGSETREVTEFHIHPDWKVHDEREQYEANLAILVLNENVTFRNYIRQVCLPTDDFLSVDTNGFIAGWGLAKNSASHSGILKHSEKKVLDNEFCIGTHSYLSSNSTFCVACNDGPTIQYDDGGGFFVLSGSVWKQFGIILAVGANLTNYITVISFAYTKKWIAETVKQSGSAVGEVERVKFDMECGKWSTDNMYSCSANVDTHSDNVEIADVVVSHSTGKTNLDVEHIQFSGGMTYVPDGIGNIFTNLKSLQFHAYGIQAHRRSGFRNMGNLVKIIFYSNYMDIPLEEDCLHDLPNLEEFSLNSNYLKEIKEKTFINNPKLREIILIAAFTLKVLPKYLLKNNYLLEKFDVSNNEIENIDEQMFANNPKLRDVNLCCNRLEQLPGNLFENNLLLEVVNFSFNNLKFIEINFAAFKNIQEIYLTNNLCTNSNSTNFRTIERAIDFNPSYYTNLNEFQNEIRANCSSKES